MRVNSNVGPLVTTATIVLVWTAVSLRVSGLLAEPPKVREPALANQNSPIAKLDRPDEAELTVSEARARAKLLHETYKSTLQAIHRQYFRDDGRLPIPSRVLEEVFADVAFRSNIKARWIAVNAQVMTLGHEPQDDFEKQAARALAAGKDEYESAENGVYRRAGSIALFSSCLKCHAPAPMRPEVHRVAGLVISVPLRQKAP